MKSIFDKNNSLELINRIETIDDSQPQWGKMNAAQMCAHCSKTFDAAFDKDQPKPNFLMRVMVKLMAKEMIIGNKPYKKNSPTAPSFVITDERDLGKEKEILINNVKKAQELGTLFFEGKAHPIFGSMRSDQWNTLIVKHTEHHLNQFGK